MLWIALAAVVLCGPALLPTHILSLAAGWALGPWLGLPVAWLSILAAVACSYALGGALAGHGLASSLRADPARRAVYDALVRASPARTATLVALLRLSPLAPFAATNVALAGLGLGWRPVLLGSALGLAPRVAVVALLGAGSAELDFSRPDAPWLLAFGVAATLVALIWSGRVATLALRRATGS